MKTRHPMGFISSGVFCVHGGLRNAELEAETKEIEELEAAKQRDEDDAAQAEKDHAEAVSRGRKGLKKLK